MAEHPTKSQDTLLALIDSIEHELRRLGLWSKASPGITALSSEQPFCYDTLDFSQWMQWIFMPRIREVLREQRDMPGQSNIHAYAEEALKNTPYDGDQLLFLIKTFDELVATVGDQSPLAS